MSGRNKIVVIGAGPAGIAAGLALGEEAVVLDSAEDPGGLSRTLKIDGAVVDLGGHSFHTPHAEVRKLVFGALEMSEQRRDARCFVKGTMIPYPFQANFQEIGDRALAQECARGCENRESRTSPRDFPEYLQSKFGEGICRHFLLPYNQKLWGGNLQRLSADWAGERVADAAEFREKTQAEKAKRTPLKSTTRVAYPAQGGFGEIYRALAAGLADLRLGKTVEQIDSRRRQVVLEGGEAIAAHEIISTIPLDRLLKITSDCPPDLCEEVDRLEKLSLAFVVAVIDHPVDTPVQRIYCADDTSPAHKIALNHNSSESLKLLPRHGIVAEVSYSPHRPLPASQLEEQVIDGLLAMGAIESPAVVRTTKTIRVEYGYPVPTHERDRIVERARAWLQSRGIHTVGRFGEWAYINSDEALYRGMRLGEKLAN